MNNNDFDKYNLRQVILEYPNQLELGKSFVKDIKLEKKEYSNLIICGMGGSALPADILISYLNDKHFPFTLPIHISRTYNLPNTASSDSLIFISSYSGNTEETLSCFQEALSLEATIVAFSAGGNVETIAKKNRIPHVKYIIDFKAFQPRYAATYAFVAMNELLTKIGLSDTIEQLNPFNNRSLEIKGEKLAKKIKGKTAIIYASCRLKILAKIWKIKINENSKTPAFWNYFPELNHNEINGFVHPQGKFYVVMLKDSYDHPKNNERIKVTAKLYRDDLGIDVSIVDIKGTTFIQQLIWTMVLGDWVSYYLAYEYKQDPTPVKIIKKLKIKLKALLK